MRFYRRFLVFVGMALSLLALTAMPSAHAEAASPVNGFWLTENHSAIVELHSCGQRTCGRFAWLKDEEGGQISRDFHNHDPALRDRLICNLQFISDFTAIDSTHYEDGDIYNPEDGLTYSADMTVMDHETLKIHGYVLLPILGQGEIWKRVTFKPTCGARLP